MHTLIFRASAHLVTSLMLVFAVYLLLRGHNAPGGGFIAGLIVVIAMALLMLAEDAAYIRRRLYYSPVFYAVSGIVVALLAGFIPLLFGKAFLTGVWAPQLPIGTPLLFDVGVFFAVLGSVLTILLNVEEELS